MREILQACSRCPIIVLLALDGTYFFAPAVTPYRDLHRYRSTIHIQFFADAVQACV